MGFFDDLLKALGLRNSPTTTPGSATAPDNDQGVSGRFESENIAFEGVIQHAHAALVRESNYFYDIKVNQLEAYTQIVAKWDDQKRIDFLIDCCKQIRKVAHSGIPYPENRLITQRVDIRAAFVQHLLRAKLVMSDFDIARILEAFRQNNRYQHGRITNWPLNYFLNQIISQRKDQKISASLKSSLETLEKELELLTNSYDKKEIAKLSEKLAKLLFSNLEQEGVVRPIQFLGDDPFTVFTNEQLDQLPEQEKVLWYPIIEKAQKASGSKPSKKYLADSKALYQSLGVDKFKRMLTSWIEFVVKHQVVVTTQHYTYGGANTEYQSYKFLDAINLDALKGLVWMCANFYDKATLQSIAELAEKSFRKIPGTGPTAAGLGNACIFVLFKSRGMDGIGHLSRLKLRVKQNSTQKLIEKYLLEAAKSQGISVSEIEDLAVNDYGLIQGKANWEFDDFSFSLEITKAGKTNSQWIKSDGKVQKTIPAKLKEKHAKKLKKLKATVKEIEQASSAQRDRLDRLFRNNRTLSWTHFETYYHQHGLMSFLSNKIIWTFLQNETSTEAMFVNGVWKTVNDGIFEPLESCEVKIWHPALSPVAQVQAWRSFLVSNEILQPIKQAFREIYLLTEAEVNTRLYSNRMAAHILKQHQFNSLTKTRGWKYALLGAYDDGRENGKAELELLEFGVKAEFWVDEVNADGAWNDTGIWDCVATDQLRFISIETGQPLELVEVPKLAFSEAMRDVDLFVGVASVGNDPLWQDSGGIPTTRDYWTSYAFGDLSESSKMRKELLSSLIPRLKIKNIAEIKGNFLILKGKLRTYKIHIGSTNILMEPNDEYLCIVPDRSAKNQTENLFIPFEGDAGLSIVLSKAFLLADDDQIMDTTITSQINRK